MKKLLLSLLTATLSMADTTQEAFNATIIEELANLKEALYAPDETYESVSSMGVAASKVYHTKENLSIGGYGELKAKKYFNYQNYASQTANETRNLLESNIVRFVPYIGYKFSESIIMNTEIEFEDGGARSDGADNYKYAIVEFSYVDFIFSPEVALRVGHILVPMGSVNLNHEPTAFISVERPTVESYIIPSTWHTNGILLYGNVWDIDYYAGLILSPDAGEFTAGRFIQQGRLGARIFSEYVSGVARAQYATAWGASWGASALLGSVGIALESAPSVSTGNSGDETALLGMAEVHANFDNGIFKLDTLATLGTLQGDSFVDGDSGETIPTWVGGAYLTAGYNLLSLWQSTQRLYTTAEIEYLDMDMRNVTTYSGNNKFFDYSVGLAYFPDPKVVVKADAMLRDYASTARVADEFCLTAVVGFIF